MNARVTTSALFACGSLRLSGVLVLALACFCVNVRAGDASLEYQVKAAFLLKVLNFVEWPQDGAQSTQPGSPLVVGVIGKDPFGVVLDSTFSGRSVEGRPIVLRRCANEEEAAACHLVFVAADSKLTPLLDTLQKKNVLAIGESGDFLRNGGIIRLAIDDERVRFDVNLASADRARLRISAKLLQLARKVFRKGDMP